MCGGIFSSPKPPPIKQPREVQPVRSPNEGSQRQAARRRVESKFKPPATMGPNMIISRGAKANSQPVFGGSTLLG